MDDARLQEELARTRAELAEAVLRAGQDLAVARRLQRAMLPRVPRSDRFECAVLDRPSEVVGGDLYDVHLTAAGRLRVFVADTTGHGVEAALRTMVVRGVLDRHRTRRVAPAELLALVNDDIVGAFPGLDMRFAAACLELELDAEPGEAARVEYADAALPPLVRARGGRAEEFSLGGTFVGMVHGARFEALDLEVEPGDRLVLYTDGLVEQFDPRGARVAEPLVLGALAAPGAPDAALGRLADALDAFREGRAQEDDVTALAVDYRGGERSWITRW